MGKIYIAGGMTLCLLTAGFGGDAMAATTKIASKGYVDAKVDGLADTYADKTATANALNLKADKSAVDELAATVNTLTGDEGSIKQQIDAATADLNAAIAEKANSSTVTALGNRVTTNENAITTLNGDAETEGSVRNLISGKADKVDAAGAGKVAIIANDGNYSASEIAFGDLVTNINVETKISSALSNNDSIKEIVGNAADDAIDAALNNENGAIKSALNAKADTADVTALGVRVSNNETTITGLEAAMESVASQTDFNNLSSKVTANETAITKLNGDAETEGSVAYQIKGKADQTEVTTLSGTVAGHTTSIGNLNTNLAGLLSAGEIPNVCSGDDATAGCALVFKGSGFTWEVIERADGE
ncbi:hypothetical protein HDR66_02115 [bacterium]|nr:hypothetical protein [bacterium]